MVFQNPLAKPFLVFVQRQIPVLRLTHHGLAAADGTLRINQVRGAEAGAAPVSYTHLDVYKRQPQKRALVRARSSSQRLQVTKLM